MRRKLLFGLLISLLLLPVAYATVIDYYKSPPYANGKAWAYGTGGGGYYGRYKIDLSTGIQRLYIVVYSGGLTSAEVHTTFNDNPLPPEVYVPQGWDVRARVSGEAIGYINPSSGSLGGIYSKLWRDGVLRDKQRWKIESYSQPKMVQTSFIEYTYWVTERTTTAKYTVTEEAIVGMTGSGSVDFYYLASSQQREVWVSTLGLEVRP